MALAEEDIDYIKTHIGDWLAEQSLGKPPAVYELELRERMIRVEEELKHQRELMQQGFGQAERRFEQIDKRFEQVDKRFEQVDKRFEALQKQMDVRFEQVEKRFEQIDKRFEQVDKRFEQVDKRFGQVDKRLDMQHEQINAIGKKHDRLLWAIFAGVLALFFKAQLMALVQ
jgi:septation ring formation regulator EzrA